MRKTASTGKFGEKLAESFLLKSNFKIIGRNFHCPYGEIDIIAKKDGEFYFVEVKTRSGNVFGEPVEAVDNRKLVHFKKSALFYVSRYGYSGDLHFLVISVCKINGQFVVNSSIEIEEI